MNIPKDQTESKTRAEQSAAGRFACEHCDGTGVVDTPSFNNCTFAELLEANRAAKGIAQNYLADLMKISPQYLNDLLRARRGPTPELATKAALVFGQSIQEWHRIAAIQCGWEI